MAKRIPMKFTCSTKDMAFAVAAAAKIVNAHTTVPILSNVKLHANGDASVTVTATDLELTIVRSFPAEVSEPGESTIPAGLLSGYLGNLPAGLLQIEGSDTRARINVERSKYDFNGLPPDDYPPLPRPQKGATVRIDSKIFRDAVNGTIFAASNDEARGAVLMGALVEIEEDRVVIVATDGYRLAKWSGKLVEGLPKGKTARYIVPARALAEAARNFAASETIDFTALGENSNQLSFDADATSIVVRLVDGQYPNYQQVIPTKFDRSVTVKTAELAAGLKRAEGMTGDRASMVKVEISNRELIITATSDTTGNAYEEIAVEQSGDDITVAFNAKYLLEILKHIDSPDMIMEFLGPLSPAAIRPLDAAQSDMLYVLMPLRQ
jgi:DNA polymerase-3 subunit beta